ncbi:MAG TPA: hypothetical protein VJ983_08990 [candidate division Zixibacteria bacterium]|nr:hypothetical protein [candidate division Zixibacteria bacterium]
MALATVTAIKVVYEQKSSRELKRTIDELNSTVNAMYGPVMEMAKNNFPDLDSTTAIRKLTQEMKELQDIATRDVYRPPNAEIRNRTIDNLRRLRNTHPAIRPSVRLFIGTGSGNRSRLCVNLVEILKEAGFSAEIVGSSTVFPVGVMPVITLQINPKDEDFATMLFEALRPYVRIGQHSVRAERTDSLARGEMVITIVGEPSFDPDGSVQLR